MANEVTAADKLAALAAGAVEAEADQNRHVMEEAVLATAAAAPPGDAFSLEFAFAVGTNFTFTRKDYIGIALALVDSIISGIAADKIIIQDALKKAGVEVAEEVLDNILDRTRAKDTTVARAYMKKLAALDRLRKAEAAGREYLAGIASAKGQGDAEVVDVLFGNLVKAVCDLATSRGLVREHFAESLVLPGFMDKLRGRTSSTGFLGLDCGFKHLNNVLNGLSQGLFVFAGAPSCGKTSFLKQVADMVAQLNRVPVLFFSFEQAAEELRIKSLSRLSGVDSRAIWKGRAAANPDVWQVIEKAAAEYSQGPGPYLKIIEAGRESTVDRIRAEAFMEKSKAGGGPVVVIIDYLQIVPAVDPLTGRAFPSVREKVDYLCTELRRLARELDGPILAISSENREAYKTNAKPSMVAFKESGGIEYAADAAFVLWEDAKETENLNKNDWLKEDQKEMRRVVLFCLKNRNGELARINLNFTPALALFEEVGKREELSRSDALGVI